MAGICLVFHFENDMGLIRKRLTGGAAIWAKAMAKMLKDNPNTSLVPDTKCGKDTMQPWQHGNLLFQ